MSALGSVRSSDFTSVQVDNATGKLVLSFTQQFYQQYKIHILPEKELLWKCDSYYGTRGLKPQVAFALSEIMLNRL